MPPPSYSDVMLAAHQLLSMEETERQSLSWAESKELAGLHVSFRRGVQLMEDKRQQLLRKAEAAANRRRETIGRRLVALDGEEQKLRLAILKSEVLHLESVVRSCTKAVRGEVFSAAQDAQQRIKYFNKTLDVILKKEAGGRRDTIGSERYEFLLLRQRCDREWTDALRNEKILSVRIMKQEQHDTERRRQEGVEQMRRGTRISDRTGSSASLSHDAADDGPRPPPAMIRAETEPAASDTQRNSEVAERSPATKAAGSRSSSASSGSHRSQSRSSSKSRSRSASQSAASDAYSSDDDHADRTSPIGRKDDETTTTRNATTGADSTATDDGSPSKAPQPQQPHSLAAKIAAEPAGIDGTTKQPSHSREARHYRNVAPMVVVAHGREFYERALGEVANRESIKRVALQGLEDEKFQQMVRHFMYKKLAEERRWAELDRTLVGGPPESLERCALRAQRLLSEAEQRDRAHLTLIADAGWFAFLKHVGRVTLQEHNQQQLRLAKLASHSTRIARKLQKVEAEKAKLSDVTRESVATLATGNEADSGLVATSELQPYPALPTSTGGSPTKEAHELAGLLRLVDVESKRRRYVEREAMLRRMVLQIYHRQKMKDFGFFDEGKVREEQHRLAQALLDEEAAEALRQLAALDDRIATAQSVAQQKLRLQRRREALVHHETVARNAIIGDFLEASDQWNREWRSLTRAYVSTHNLALREAAIRKELERDEQRIREGAAAQCRKFMPLPPKKPLDPLPPPPAKFEEAMSMYKTFIQQQQQQQNQKLQQLSTSRRQQRAADSLQIQPENEEPPLSASSNATNSLIRAAYPTPPMSQAQSQRDRPQVAAPTPPAVGGASTSRNDNGMAQDMPTYFSSAGRKYLPPQKRHSPAPIVVASHEHLLSLYSSRGASTTPGTPLTTPSHQKLSLTLLKSAVPQPTIFLGERTDTPMDWTYRKPRPPPADVAFQSAPAVALMKHHQPTTAASSSSPPTSPASQQHRKNPKAGARLEPMKGARSKERIVAPAKEVKKPARSGSQPTVAAAAATKAPIARSTDAPSTARSSTEQTAPSRRRTSSVTMLQQADHTVSVTHSDETSHKPSAGGSVPETSSEPRQRGRSSSTASSRSCDSASSSSRHHSASSRSSSAASSRHSVTSDHSSPQRDHDEISEKNNNNNNDEGDDTRGAAPVDPAVPQVTHQDESSRSATPASSSHSTSPSPSPTSSRHSSRRGASEGSSQNPSPARKHEKGEDEKEKGDTSSEHHDEYDEDFEAD